MSRKPSQKKSKPSRTGTGSETPNEPDDWQPLLDRPLSERYLSALELLGLLALVEAQKKQDLEVSGMDRRYPDKLMSYSDLEFQDSTKQPGKPGKQ